MLIHLIKESLSLFFPRICIGCGNELQSNSEFLCLPCLADLPHTDFAKYPDNPVEKIFYGRIQIESAHSEFFFLKQGIIQQLVHELKYKSNLSIGVYLGGFIGNSLINSGRFRNYDYLVPLPLHPQKEFKRGYNQAYILCKGISAKTGIPILRNVVKRTSKTETQTKKQRMERWKNVESSFQIAKPELISGRKIILVDDVITTGATLEACASCVAHIDGTTISIVSLAFASK